MLTNGWNKNMTSEPIGFTALIWDFIKGFNLLEYNPKKVKIKIIVSA